MLENRKHERLCQLLASGETADAAYSKAGYKPDRGNAARLTANDNVKARVAELQAAGAAEAEFTVARVVNELWREYTAAVAANQHGPAVRALELIGRTVGAFVDVNKIKSDHSSLPDDEIVRRLAGDDPVVQGNVRRMLGKAAFDAA